MRGTYGYAKPNIMYIECMVHSLVSKATIKVICSEKRFFITQGNENT